MTEIEIRPVEGHEIDAYAACQAAAFASRYPADRLESLAQELQLERTIGVFDSSGLVATSASFLSSMTLPGLVRGEVAGVTDVSVSPTHRRRGFLTAMMRRQLDDLHASDETIAVLYASEGAIYGRYGYAPASFAASYVVDKRLCRLLPPGDEQTDSKVGGVAGSVRLLERNQAVEAFPLVFGAYVPTRVGEVDRPEGEWVELLGEVSSPAMGHRFYACYEQGGRIDGYAVYRVAGIDPADHWRRGVFLEELCSLSDVAYRCLWRYVLGIDLTEELLTTGRPVDEPVRFLLEDQRQLRTARWTDRSWVRLVDVKRALALRRYEEQGVLVIEVSDPFCPWNEGRFVLSVDSDGVATVEPGGAEPDIVVPAEVLSSLYLGAVAFDAMAQVGRLHESASGALRRADAMFSARRPPFCMTHF
jgi:predicted acetyltransferase